VRDRLSNILKIVISLGLLALVLYKVGAKQALTTLAAANWPLLALALALFIGGIALRAVRWQALLRAQRLVVPLQRLVFLYFVGSFFNNILPTGFGGDAVRAYELAQDAQSGALAVGTVLTDRAIGLLALFLMAALALPFSLGILQPWIALLVLALTVGAFGGVALFLWSGPLGRLFRALPAPLRRLIDRPALRKLYRSFSGYDRRSLAIAGGVSIAFNLLQVVVNALIGLSLGVHVSFSYYLVSVSIIATLLMLPITISGVGVREGAYLLLFGQVGVPAATAVSMSLSVYLINVLSGLIGGALYAWEGAHGALQARQGESKG